MKILFLDIDGVLNSSRSVLTRSGERLTNIGAYNQLRMLCAGSLPYGVKQSLDTVDPVAVDLVNRLLSKDEDLRIVLSSSHRSYFSSVAYLTQYGSGEHLAALQTYLKALGLKAERLVGCTPQLHTYRGAECRKWLEEHREVRHACALDDGADFHKGDCLHVLVNPAIGFSADDYYQVCRHLFIDESPILI